MKLHTYLLTIPTLHDLPKRVFPFLYLACKPCNTLPVSQPFNY